MSIVDIDKTSGNRSTPDINTNDSAAVRKAHNTYGNTLRRVGSAVKQFMSFAQGIIQAKDAEGNRSFFLGYDPTLSTRPVIRIAKDGYDAVNTSDDNLIFNSEQNVLKVVDTKSISLNKPASNWLGTATYTHNLGFIPAVLAFVNNSGTLSPLPLHTPVQTGYGADNGKIAISIYPDSITDTTITFKCFTPDMSGGTFGNTNYNQSIDMTIKFYLLQESAA